MDREAYHWDKFELYADADGISLDHEDDWMPWWECWCAGIDAECRYRKENDDV